MSGSVSLADLVQPSHLDRTAQYSGREVSKNILKIYNLDFSSGFFFACHTVQFIITISPRQLFYV